MIRSGADALWEEAYWEGYRQGTLRALRRVIRELLRAKFGAQPGGAEKRIRDAEKRIRATTDPEQLRAWLIRAGTASTLEEAGIGPKSPS